MTERNDFLRAYWAAVAAQDAAALRSFFAPDAVIRWHNTNERFTLEEFIRVNCEYPGNWCGRVERIEQAGALSITATHVWAADGEASFHAVSFFAFAGEAITTLDEYWGDDAPAPQWRQELAIGTELGG